MANLPDGNKIVLFKHSRRIMTTMAGNVSAASLSQRAELVRLLIDRVTAKSGNVDIVWSGPARPFFGVTSGGSAPKGIRTPDLHLERVAS